VKGVRKRVHAWWRARRRKAAAENNAAPLREFVYLDEVSVYSLVASRIGAVATEFTETEIASLQTDVAASAGVSLPSVAKADMKSQIGTTHTQQAQVVRKALIQTAFKELYEYEEGRLRLSPIDAEKPPRIGSWDDLFSSDELAPWAVRSQALGRGDLIEAEVELGADAIFRMSAVVSAITEIVNESPELRAATGTDLEQVSAMARIIERLLVGLVPLRGRVVDFDAAASQAGEEWIAHSSILDRFAPKSDVTRLPLYVVGVAEEGLFWKDVRRVLFSGSRYRVLCRLARPGTQRTWTPVKLVDVLREFSPDLAGQLGDATALMTAAAAQSLDADWSPSLPERLHQALSAYATDLVRRHEGQIDSAQLEEAVSQAAGVNLGDAGLEERRRVFTQITEHIEQTLSVSVDPVVAAQLRHTAWLESDPAMRGDSALARQDLAARRPDERYLDAEFVAIYW
jgi:hypothetical protein